MLPVQEKFINKCWFRTPRQRNIYRSKPVHASNRSNLLTYLNIFDDVRSFFSKETGMKKSMFSYNSEGACPQCHGKGVLKTELAFMPDFTQICDVCNGTRYRPEVLEAKVDGYSIADILSLTVDEAIAFFNSNPKLPNRFKHSSYRLRLHDTRTILRYTIRR